MGKFSPKTFVIPSTCLTFAAEIIGCQSDEFKKLKDAFN